MVSYTHMDYINEMLASCPVVTRQQAIRYLMKQYGTTETGLFDRSITRMVNTKMIWNEMVGETELIRLIGLNNNNDAAMLDFPYAFELYLNYGASYSTCEVAKYPFTAQFFRAKKDNSTSKIEVAVYDCKGRNPTMHLAKEVYDTTVRTAEAFVIPKKSFQSTFCRILLIKNCTRGFLESDEFQYLRGVGFSLFFATMGYDKSLELVLKEADVEEIWSRYR